MSKGKKKRAKITKLKLIIIIIAILCIAAGGFGIYNFVRDKEYIITQVIDDTTSNDITVVTTAGFLKEELSDGIKEGYSFNGLYIDQDLSIEFKRYKHRITSNTTLYAKMTINTYSFSFDSDGGSAVGPMSFNHGSIIVEPVPTRANYLFTGWFKDNTLTERYDFDSPYNQNGMLFAGWVLIDDALTYTVSGGNYTITGYKDDVPSHLIIPEVINGGEVIAIADSAFLDCVTLLEVRIHSLSLTLGSNIFSGCNSMKSITIPHNSYGYLNLSNFFGNNYASVPDTLKSVIVADGVTVISSGAFGGCNNIRTIILPDSVTTIESGAFINCSNLRDIVIPDGVTTIGDSAFNSCTKLEIITIPSSTISISNGLFDNCINLQTITLHDSIQSIGSSAFNNCKSLESIFLSNNITTIGIAAFYSCEKLTSVTIPSGITEIKASTFANCKDLNNVILPQGLVVIGMGAFTNCFNLSQIVFPDTLEKIDMGAFSYCSRLNNVVTPASLRTIDNSAFISCSALTNLTLTEGLTRINLYAFANCSALTKVTLPSTITTLEGGVFTSCALNEVTVLNPIPPEFSDSNMFQGSGTYLKIYVPSAAVDDYKVSWSYFSSNIYPIVGE